MLNLRKYFYLLVLFILFFISGSVKAQSFLIYMGNSSNTVYYTSGWDNFWIKNNGPGTLYWSESLVSSWLHFNGPSQGSLSSGSSINLTISWDSNNGPQQRTSTIYVYSNSGTYQSLTVTQIASPEVRLLTAINIGTGHIVITPSSGPYYYGQQITLQDYPDPGYTFYRWSGIYASFSNPFTFTITNTGNIDLVANQYISGKESQLNQQFTGASEIPAAFSIKQNYPNPFNPSTNVDYQLPQNSHVTIKVYDIIGHEVATLNDGIKEAGYYSTKFDGSRLSSGIYFLRLTAIPQNGDKTIMQTMKMMLMK